ncbi:hypothetical protein [Endozoicomonas numazuensis]|nr:hypothetical protein [Endozoicomonas numazuensis]
MKFNIFNSSYCVMIFFSCTISFSIQASPSCEVLIKDGQNEFKIRDPKCPIDSKVSSFKKGKLIDTFFYEVTCSDNNSYTCHSIARIPDNQFYIAWGCRGVSKNILVSEAYLTETDRTLGTFIGEQKRFTIKSLLLADMLIGIPLCNMLSQFSED